MDATDMTPVQKTALTRAVLILSALPVKFAIVEPNGNQYGTLPIAPPEPAKPVRAKRNSSYPYGTASTLFDEHAKHLAVGEVAIFPHDMLPKYSRKKFVSAVTAWAHRQWGAGSYISTFTGDNVELLRVA